MTLENRMQEIDRRPAETPSKEDLKAIAAAEAEGFSSAMPLDAFLASLDGYSGKLVLRLPRSLHKRLKAEAAAEGVSLNQYMLYKLAR